MSASTADRFLITTLEWVRWSPVRHGAHPGDGASILGALAEKLSLTVKDELARWGLDFG